MGLSPKPTTTVSYCVALARPWAGEPGPHRTRRGFASVLSRANTGPCQDTVQLLGHEVWVAAGVLLPLRQGGS